MSQPREVVSRLVARGLVSTERVVEGDLTVTDASRRNRNLKVVSTRGPSYFVKHATHQASAALLAQEAWVYSLLHSDPEGIGAHVPASHGYDPASGMMVLGLLSDCESLLEHHARLRSFPPAVGAAMGETLAKLHRLPLPADAAHRLPRHPPGMFNLLRPHVSYMSEVSGANLKVMSIVQQFPELMRMLDELQAGWRPETLVHGDLKWDNALVAKDPPGAPPRLRIVDWESGGLGEPAWDAGSVLNDYLSCWLNSMPVTPDATPDRLLRSAGFPLDAMLPAVHAFWSAYVRGMGYAPAEAARRQERAARWAGARLIQTAFEHMQAHPQITGNAVVMLQLAQNVLARPRDALTHLLGFPPGGSAR